MRARLLALLLLGACSAAPAPGPWRDLLRGPALDGWSVTDFGGQGEVEFADGAVQLGMGSPLTGITWTREFPTRDYELGLQFARTLGVDFPLGLTFPVGDAHLSLVLGGWGGAVCGLSSLDGRDAANNETRTLRAFQTDRSYDLRLCVRLDRVQVWIDQAPFLDVDLRGHVLGLRSEMLLSRPLGCASYATAARLRDLRWRPLPAG
jgi:hypothetical protein